MEFWADTTSRCPWAILELGVEQACVQFGFEDLTKMFQRTSAMANFKTLPVLQAALQADLWRSNLLTCPTYSWCADEKFLSCCAKLAGLIRLFSFCIMLVAPRHTRCASKSCASQ